LQKTTFFAKNRKFPQNIEKSQKNFPFFTKGAILGKKGYFTKKREKRVKTAFSKKSKNGQDR